LNSHSFRNIEPNFIMDIAGKTILITGADTDIGHAAAVGLAEWGARLALVGREQSALDATLRMANAEGGDAMTLAGDITDAAWRDEVVDKLCAHFDSPDILINCVHGDCAAALENAAPDDIREQIETNLLAPILLIRAALPGLRQSTTEAAIVNVTSASGLVGPPCYSASAAARAGLARFGEALRRELAADDIHVMTVYPITAEASLLVSDDVVAHGESTQSVAEALIAGLQDGATDVVRGGDEFAQLLDLNHNDARAADEQIRQRWQRRHDHSVGPDST